MKATKNFILSPEDINLPRYRKPESSDVAIVQEGIAAIGQRMPISIRKIESTGGGYDYILVTGAKRRQACINLGIAVECRIETGDELDAELWEVSENFHRGKLSAAENAELKTRWGVLLEKRTARDAKGIAPAIPLKPKKTTGRGNKGGQSDAARKANMSQPAMNEAARIAKLPAVIKEAAKNAGVDSHKELLAIAKTPEAERKDKIAALKAKRTTNKQTNPLVAAWDRASNEMRSEFAIARGAQVVKLM